MKKGALFILLIGVAAGIGFWIQRTYQPPRQAIPDPLTIGTSADYKPLEFEEQGNIKGFEIDLVKELAHRLGVTHELHNMQFDFLLLSLQQGSLHVIAAGLNATPERAEHALFSDPYITEDPLVVITKKEKAQEIQSFEDLYNRNVAVNEGYTAERYMQVYEPNISLTRFDSVSNGILALEANKVDAFVAGSHSLQAVFAEYESDHFHAFTIHDATEQIALAISQAYPKLRDEINRLLQEMRDDGTLSQLKSQWGIS